MCASRQRTTRTRRLRLKQGQWITTTTRWRHWINYRFGRWTWGLVVELPHNPSPAAASQSARLPSRSPSKKVVVVPSCWRTARKSNLKLHRADTRSLHPPGSTSPCLSYSQGNKPHVRGRKQNPSGPFKSNELGQRKQRWILHIFSCYSAGPAKCSGINYRLAIVLQGMSHRTVDFRPWQVSVGASGAAINVSKSSTCPRLGRKKRHGNRHVR